MSDGYNNYRTARVAELLADFRTLQYYIAAVECNPANMDDYYTEGWAQLRQCALDGQHILNCAADVTVPRANGGPEEQERAELMQVLLDAYARRHEGQKIYLRQQAAQLWVEWRRQILMGGRPHSGNQADLDAIDEQLRTDLANITDEIVDANLRESDVTMGRWTAVDPSLRAVQRWVRTRRC